MFGGVPRLREQLNTLTSYLDAGQLYGSEEGLAHELRDLTTDGGLMRINDRFRDNGRELLPFTKVPSKMCATRNRILNTTGLEEVPCFIAGGVCDEKTFTFMRNRKPNRQTLLPFSSWFDPEFCMFLPLSLNMKVG